MLKTRKRIKSRMDSPLVTFFRELFWDCCGRWCCRATETDLHCAKAQDTLNRELDIKHFIRNIRLIRNSIKFLTTHRERMLTRMQADKNVIILKTNDKRKYKAGLKDLTSSTSTENEELLSHM